MSIHRSKFLNLSRVRKPLIFNHLQNSKKSGSQFRLFWVAIQAELPLNSGCFGAQPRLDCTLRKAELTPHCIIGIAGEQSRWRNGGRITSPRPYCGISRRSATTGGHAKTKISFVLKIEKTACIFIQSDDGTERQRELEESPLHGYISVPSSHASPTSASSFTLFMPKCSRRV